MRAGQRLQRAAGRHAHYGGEKNRHDEQIVFPHH